MGRHYRSPIPIGLCAIAGARCRRMHYISRNQEETHLTSSWSALVQKLVDFGNSLPAPSERTRDYRVTRYAVQK